MLLFLWPDLASVGLPWNLLVEALFVELFCPYINYRMHCTCSFNFPIEDCRLLDYLVYQNPG